MACGCNSTSSASKNGALSDVDASNFKWTGGTFQGGAALTICNTSREITVSAVRAPNILVFAESPCLTIGDGLIIENISSVSCIKNMSRCVSVTAAPVLVGTTYEVAVNGNWQITNGTNTVTLQAATSSIYCGTTEAAANLVVKTCSGAPVIGNFSGHVFTRPLNSPPSIGGAFVATGVSKITTKDNYFTVRAGDKIELDQTAIVGTNAATVLSVSRGRSATTSELITTIVLDRAVTGITAVAAVGSLPCVTATATPQAIASLTFAADCSCCVVATLDKSITSQATFPQGTPYEDGHSNGCQKQIYCFSINVDIPNAETRTITGQLILG